MTDTFEERQITRDEIRVGDRILATYLNSGGIKETYEFTVEGVEGNILKTPEGGEFHLYDTLYDYILLDRPKPALPTEPGSVIVDVETYIRKYPIMLLVGDELWHAPTSTSEEATYYAVLSENIQSWSPARVVKGEKA